jgi:hypothetical protein
MQKKAPCLAAERFEMCYFLTYQVREPWHPGVPQVFVVELKFKVFMMFIVPLACVAVFTVVEL